MSQVEQEYCRFMISSECLNVGPKDTFTGRCCKNCHLMKRKLYYLANRDRIIERSKLRQNVKYIHKRTKKVDEDPPNEENEDSPQMPSLMETLLRQIACAEKH